MRTLSFVILLGAALSGLSPSAEAPSYPTNEDLRHFRGLNDPRLSPDGRQVLVRITDSTAEGAKSHLWLVDIGPNTSRQLTYSPDSDKGGELRGEWFPDGKSILFLAHRGANTQLFRLPLDGGEARPYEIKVPPEADASKLPDAIPPSGATAKTETKSEPLAADVDSFTVSPDGKRIAIIAKDPQTPGEKKQADAKADAVWVDHDLHGKRLYLFDPATSEVTPVPVPADVRGAAWSHDGARLFVTQEEGNGASDLGPADSGWLVEVNALKAERVAALPRTLSGAAWTVDDQAIVFLSQSQTDTPPGYTDVFEYRLPSGQTTHVLADGFSGSILSQAPIPLAGGAVVQVAGIGVKTAALRIAPGRQPEILESGVPAAASFHTNARRTGWVFVGSGSTQPPAVFYTEDLQKPGRILHTPSLVPTNARSAESRRVQWKSDGLTIEGLLYLPEGGKTRRVPLIVEVHGGPTGAYVDGYEPFVNSYVGQGWAVLRPNPRGSTNYGAAFAAANKNDLGGGDYRDIMAGVDFVLKTEPIDADRLGLEGYSYGGEMAGFVEGKTDRFKGIVSGAPVIDQYSEYGTEDSSWYDRWFFGKPWEHPADAWRQSPLAGVVHAKTPFLILQGEGDLVDPPGQAREMYRALRQMGVPVDLITYPRDNHGPLSRAIYGLPVAEPWHGFDARQRIVRFFKKAFGEGD